MNAIGNFLADFHPPHLYIVGLVLLFVFVLYRPPGQLNGLRDFVERHFGDTLGLYILHLGILLVIIGGFYTQVQTVSRVGESLIMASMVALKLKTVPGADSGNGNGSGPSQKTVSTTETTSISVGSPPVATPEHL